MFFPIEVGPRTLHQGTAELALKKFCGTQHELPSDESSLYQQAYVLRTMRSHIQKAGGREGRKRKTLTFLVASAKKLPRLPQRTIKTKKAMKGKKEAIKKVIKVVKKRCADGEVPRPKPVRLA